MMHDINRLLYILTYFSYHNNSVKLYYELEQVYYFRTNPTVAIINAAFRYD